MCVCLYVCVCECTFVFVCVCIYSQLIKILKERSITQTDPNPAYLPPCTPLRQTRKRPRRRSTEKRRPLRRPSAWSVIYHFTSNTARRELGDSGSRRSPVCVALRPGHPLADDSRDSLRLRESLMRAEEGGGKESNNNTKRKKKKFNPFS